MVRIVENIVVLEDGNSTETIIEISQEDEEQILDEADLINNRKNQSSASVIVMGDIKESKDKTGNTIFTINERFTSIESIQRHVENASKNDYFPQFYEIMGNYGKVVGIGGEVLHSIR